MLSGQSRLVLICLRALLLCEAGPSHAPRYPFMTSEFDRQMQEVEHTLGQCADICGEARPLFLSLFQQYGALQAAQSLQIVCADCNVYDACRPPPSLC